MPHDVQDTGDTQTILDTVHRCEEGRQAGIQRQREKDKAAGHSSVTSCKVCGMSIYYSYLPQHLSKSEKPRPAETQSGKLHDCPVQQQKQKQQQQQPAASVT